jgi:hypothetical protein
MALAADLPVSLELADSLRWIHDVSDEDAGSLGEEPTRVDTTDPGGAAGDDGHPVRELHGGDCSGDGESGATVGGRRGRAWAER